MSFQTFTCVVCGKTGLTKRNSYQYASGRACRTHIEVVTEARHRNHPEEFDEKLKAKYFVEKCIKQKKIDLPVSTSSFDIVSIVWIIDMMMAVCHIDAATPEFIREMISQLKETNAYKVATHWYLDQYIEILEVWNPKSDHALEFTDLIGRGQDQLVRIQADMKFVKTFKQEGFKIWKLINDLVKFYHSNFNKYNQYSGTIIDTLKRRISLAMCIVPEKTTKRENTETDNSGEYITFITKVRTAINQKENGLKDSVFIDLIECIIKFNKGDLYQ